MRLLAEQIHELEIPGDAAELGVYRGDFAVHINAAFPDRLLHLFDTFEGFAEKDVALESREGLSRAKTGRLFRHGRGQRSCRRMPYPEQTAVYTQGWFPDDLRAGCEGRSFAFVSIDADLYAPNRRGPAPLLGPPERPAARCSSTT